MGIVIGVVGTAKNTGKTTTTSAIINELDTKRLPLGLTSIGYDGEEIDNITGLPKPRLLVKKNTVLATAQKCLEVSDARFDLLSTTDIYTPLGRIHIVKVVKEGLAVIAGPNKGSQLKLVTDRMINDFKCQIVVSDGALNRMAPMIETDGIIIATGAARSNKISTLVKEIKSLCFLLGLPKTNDENIKNFMDIKNIALIPKEKNNSTCFLQYGSLIGNDIVKEIISKMNHVKTIYIPSLISEPTFKQLNNDIGNMWNKRTLVIKDPMKIIVGGNPRNLETEINNIILKGGSFKTLKNLPLLAITVNPFYPKYRFDLGSFEPGYVDSDELRNKMRESLNIPVIDIKHDGALKLLEIISEQGLIRQ